VHSPAKGFNRLPVIRAIIESGLYDLEARTKHGWTALLKASFAGHEDIVSLLLAHDGKANTVAYNSCLTPLIAASQVSLCL
jgi:ankyrin repeat protein